MKTNYLKGFAAFVTIASVAVAAYTSQAQEATSAYTIQPAPAAAPAPQIGYGVSQVLQLQQANVGDETIISYIKNSGNSYGLNADQIIYLKQQGISSAVINTMLTQPTTGAGVAPANSVQGSVVATPVTADAATYYDSQPRQSIVGPSVSGIDPSAAAAASYYYYPPVYNTPTYYSSYYAPYYYPSYGFYPRVSVAWGFHGGWGGGFHGGGFHGGGFHGGGFHGGWHH